MQLHFNGFLPYNTAREKQLNARKAAIRARNACLLQLQANARNGGFALPKGILEREIKL